MRVSILSYNARQESEWVYFPKTYSCLKILFCGKQRFSYDFHPHVPIKQTNITSKLPKIGIIWHKLLNQCNQTGAHTNTMWSCTILCHLAFRWHYSNMISLNGHNSVIICSPNVLKQEDVFCKNLQHVYLYLFWCWFGSRCRRLDQSQQQSVGTKVLVPSSKTHWTLAHTDTHTRLKSFSSLSKWKPSLSGQ